METQFVLLLSPAGGGKTSLIRNTVPVLAEEGKKVAIIFNDDGDPDAVDMPNDVRRFADLETMTAGCFGCDDADALVKKLHELNGNVDVVLIEPIGFTSAGEMINVFGLAGLSPFVITLVDAEHLEANLRIGTLDGQVAAADVVLITKSTDANIEPAQAYVAQHKGLDSPVYEQGQSAAYTYGFEAHGHDCGHDHHEHGHDCGHDHHEHGHDCGHDHHEHDHDCGHDHPHGHDHVHIVPRHIRLKSDVTLEELRERFDEGAAIRAKGKIGDVRYSMVHGEWDTEEGDPNSPNFVTYYTVTSEQSDRVAARLQGLGLDFRYASRGTADEVRDHDGDGTLLLETIEKCETMGLTFVGGHPVSNPQWQELLNELRKRPGVPEDLQARSVRARVRHLLECGEWYLENDGMDEAAPWSTLHGIAVGVAWFCSEQPERVGGELIQRATQLPLVRWLSAALLGRDKTNSDIGREQVMADEAGITARWGLSNAIVGPADRDQCAAAMRHSIELAEIDGRETIVSGWKGQPERIFG